MLRGMPNTDHFAKYESTLPLSLRNADNLSETKRILAAFRESLQSEKPTADAAKAFLSRYTNHKPRTVYRYAQMIKAFMKWYGEPLKDVKVKIPKTLPPYTTDEDLDKLLSEIRQKKTHKGQIERDTLNC